MNNFDKLTKQILLESEELFKTTDPSGVVHYWKDRLHTILHNPNGPAITSPNGIKVYAVNNKFHRLDGPAVEGPNDHKQWFINNKKYTEEEFNKIVKDFKPEDLDIATDITSI